jgi:hypothetical protein
VHCLLPAPCHWQWNRRPWASLLLLLLLLLLHSLLRSSLTGRLLEALLTLHTARC